MLLPVCDSMNLQLPPYTAQSLIISVSREPVGIEEVLRLPQLPHSPNLRYFPSSVVCICKE